MKSLKILFPIILVISFSFLPLSFGQQKSGTQRVPDFVASTVDGESFALKNWMQKPDTKILILTFFATWCELCDEDFEFFHRLQEQYADQGLRVFCIFTGSLSRIRAVKEYLESLKIDLPVLIDNKRVISRLYKVAGFPCTYLIDREGFLRIKCLGCSEEVKINFERNLKDLLAPQSRGEIIAQILTP